jgi:fido (protein-threonine AMPylation protein)
MRDFPVDDSPTVDHSLKRVYSRFNRLNTDEFVLKLMRLDEIDFSKLFSHLPLFLHSYLFKGIFSNAGNYRSHDDPGNGYIAFGLRQKFRGVPPSSIEDGVNRAISNLTKNTEDAVVNAVRFYQQFVMVHPFYDANGRIGRFILETYLNYHGIGVMWGESCSNEKWINKLNKCHKRFDQPNYDEYLGFLVNHWRKFTFQERITP